MKMFIAGLTRVAMSISTRPSTPKAEAIATSFLNVEKAQRKVSSGFHFSDRACTCSSVSFTRIAPGDPPAREIELAEEDSGPASSRSPVDAENHGWQTAQLLRPPAT